MNRSQLFPVLQILMAQWLEADAMSQRITDLEFVMTEVLAMCGYSDAVFSTLDMEDCNGTQITCRDDQDFGRKTSFTFTA